MEWQEEFKNRFEERVKEFYLNEYKVVPIKFLHDSTDLISFKVEENERNIINYQSISVIPFSQFALSYALRSFGDVYWEFGPTRYVGTKVIKFALWKFESFAKIWEMVSKEDKKLQLARFKTNTDSYKEFDLVYTSNLKIDEINNKKIPIITTYLYRDELQEFIKKYKIGYKSSSKFIPDDKSSWDKIIDLCIEDIKKANDAFTDFCNSIVKSHLSYALEGLKEFLEKEKTNDLEN